MKIYLDNSFLNRPFDDQNLANIRLETEVLFWILKLIKENKVILVNSAIIEYENSLNPFLERKIFVEDFLKNAEIYQNVNPEIYNEAQKLMKKFKIKSYDALHLACALFAKVDYFITCDYNLVKRYKGKLKVVTPLEFFKKYEKYKN
jgi:predicted nucleic acid-binding protein